jgi:hypothetical protein
VIIAPGEDIDQLWAAICAVINHQGPAAGTFSLSSLLRTVIHNAHTVVAKRFMAPGEIFVATNISLPSHDLDQGYRTSKAARTAMMSYLSSLRSSTSLLEASQIRWLRIYSQISSPRQYIMNTVALPKNWAQIASSSAKLSIWSSTS